MGPVAGHLARALRLSDQLGLREGPSARARGLRPAPPVGPLTSASRAALPRRRGRLPEEAMSEGAHVSPNLASLTLRLSDPATARFSLLRPGRRVPTRETAPTPGDSAKDCLTGLRRSRGSH